MDQQFVKKIEDLNKKYNPQTQQLQVLTDIADMVQELLTVADNTKSNTDQLRALGAVLDDSRQQLVALNKREDPETPDYAGPVVKAVGELSKEITSQLSKLDMRPQVNVAAPHIPAPEVNVAPTDVKIDLSKVEKILQSDIPKAFREAIGAIPAPKEFDPQPIVDGLSELKDWLESIDKASRMKPQFPNTLRVTNADGSRVDAGFELGADYDSSYFSNADANGNYQTITNKLSGTTVRTLTLTYDASSNVTSIVKT